MGGKCNQLKRSLSLFYRYASPVMHELRVSRKTSFEQRLYRLSKNSNFSSILQILLVFWFATIQIDVESSFFIYGALTSVWNRDVAAHGACMDTLGLMGYQKHVLYDIRKQWSLRFRCTVWKNRILGKCVICSPWRHQFLSSDFCVPKRADFQ